MGITLAHSGKSVLASGSPTLTWLASTTSGTLTYEIQIDDDSLFRTPVVDYTGSELTNTPTLANGRFYWRVRALNDLVEPRKS